MTPFIIHKKWCQEKKPMKKGLWQVTHLFTGKGIAVDRLYKFCKAVAEGLMDEPWFGYFAKQCGLDNPDVSRVSKKLNELKEINERLGRW